MVVDLGRVDVAPTCACKERFQLLMDTNVHPFIERGVCEEAPINIASGV